MNVQIKLVKAGYYDREKGWKKGIILATVEGHSVALLENKGWDCRCGDEKCEHIPAVEKNIHPRTLAQIEEGRSRK